MSKNFNSEHDLYTITVYNIVCKYFRASDVDLPTRIWPLSHWKLFSHLSPLTNKFLTSNVYTDSQQYSFLFRPHCSLRGNENNVRVATTRASENRTLFFSIEWKSSKILLDRSGSEKDILCISQWLWSCHFIKFVVSWIQMRSQHYEPGWLHSFFHNAFYYTDLNDCIIFCTKYFTILYKCTQTLGCSRR